MTSRTFGRRILPQVRLPVARVEVSVPVRGTVFPANDTAVEDFPALPTETDSRAIERELEEWKKARGFILPWRQLLLTASVCFGVASFVVPETANDAMQWVLLVLTGASLCAGLSRRRKQSKN